jgi:formiminoglutamase
MEIFRHLTSPDGTLLYKRNDPNDVRLGETVRTDPAALDKADIVLIGCPQDEGVRRNKGRPGAAAAPDAIRQYLYKLVAQPHVTLFDAGNTIIQATLEDTHTIHTQVVNQLLDAGKRVISLGGGNDLSYADCLALTQAYDTVLAFNVDAHFDVRADTPRNSGTPYRQLLDGNHVNPQNFYEIGSLPAVNAPTYRQYLDNIGANIIDRFAVQQNGIQNTFDTILSHANADAIFWGLDMDVVRVADAPGVSAPNPLGLSALDFCQIATIAGQDYRSRVFEITEVNPTVDIDGRTCRLAAMAIYTYLDQVIAT